MKRLVVVADNPMIVGAIHSGLRESGAFELLGYVDPRKATAARIMQARAQVVLVDEADNSEPAIALIRSLKEQDEDIEVIVLTISMDGDWLERAFAAGANGAMSKAIHPAALATLVREAVNGHIVHSPARVRSVSRAPIELADRALLAHRPRSTKSSGWSRRARRTRRSPGSCGSPSRPSSSTSPTCTESLTSANRTEACHYAHVNGLVAPGESPAPARDERFRCSRSLPEWESSAAPHGGA